jgi:hypothetical protein
MVAESYDSEALAVLALQQQADRKRRRGYQVRTMSPEDEDVSD